MHQMHAGNESCTIKCLDDHSDWLFCGVCFALLTESFAIAAASNEHPWNIMNYLTPTLRSFDDSPSNAKRQRLLAAPVTAAFSLARGSVIRQRTEAIEISSKRDAIAINVLLLSTAHQV
jgi:hypothetical protein